MKILIITPFNDIESIEGGSRSSIKSFISYFDQFLILYETINENWININFEYSFLVLHSVPFTKRKQKIIHSLKNVEVRLLGYEHHPTKIRPLAYSLELECDFRLILDVDMYALSSPTFDFTSDVQAMYGSNKYNDDEWGELCSYIGATKPNQMNLRINPGHIESWDGSEHFMYHLGEVSVKLFPYFNNGAILIRNNICADVERLWESYKFKYIKYLEIYKGVKHQISVGQDTIGIAIDNCVDKWVPFEKGFNFIIQRSFQKGQSMIDLFPIDNVKLFHYINVPEGSIYEKLVLKKYKNIKRKYYSIWHKLM